MICRHLFRITNRNAAVVPADPITEERQKILEIITEIGHDKFKAFLDMMNKRGAGPWVLFTLERMQEIAEALKTVSIERFLKNLAQSTIDPDSVPVSLQELLKHIQKYTKQEMRTRAGILCRTKGQSIRIKS